LSSIFNARVPAPTPVLKLPPVRVLSDNQPTAVFAEPVVRLRREFCPSAVLNPAYPPSGGGTTARAFGAGSDTERNRSDLVNNRIVVFIDVKCPCDLADLSR
jgi:hypothetical protein